MAAGQEKKSDIEAKKVKTGTFRVSFPKVFKAESFKGGDLKFSIRMLFPKNQPELMKPLRTAAFNATVEKFGPKENWPKRMRSPFRDGDDEEWSNTEGYRGHWFVTATCKKKPGLIDQDQEYITEESGEFYAGCYARASLIAFAYDTAGNKGTSFTLCNIQKVKNGKPFGGGKKAEDEFDAVDRDEDDDAPATKGGDEDDFG